MAEWSRIVNTTIAQYIRGEEINILRNRKLTALMRERGRISFNHSGASLDWKVRYKRAPLFGYADSDTMTFSRKNRWKTAALPWRGYATTDSLTKREKLQNRGTEAIVKFYSNMAKLLMEDIEDTFEDELYIDGYGSGNSKRIMGLESALGINGNSINISTGAERTLNTADKVAAPDDTYAGLTTGIGDYGGTWTGSWPDGEGDAHYDFWTPVLVNSDSTAFNGASDDFDGQGDEAIRYMIIRSQKNKSRRGQLDLVLLDSSWYNSFLNQIDAKERFLSRPGRNEGSLAKLGFTDVVNYDGVEVTWSFGVATSTGYGINVDSMELMSMQSQLFVPEGPDFDVASQSFRFSLDFYGQMRLDPRSMGKIAIYVT